MKTENFDDAVRRKIESIHEQNKQEDIDRVHKYVSLNRSNYILSGRRLGTLVLISTVGLFITGLLIWNLKQMGDNKTLLQTIGKLQNELAQTNSTPVKTDTVFITKYSDQTSGNTASTENLYEANTIIRSGEKDIPSTDQTNIIAGEKQKSGNTDNPVAEESVPAEMNVSNGKNKKTELISHTNGIASEQAIETNQRQNKNEVHRNEKSASDSTAKIAHQEDLDSISKTGEPVITKNNFNDTAAEATSVKNQNDKRSMFLKNWHYQAGIDFKMGNDQIGAGILGEVFFNSRWSMSAGLRILNVNNEKYHDANEFRMKKAQDFRETYAPAIPDTTFVSDIDMQYLVLQIPVMLTYHLPLKNNFGIIFSAGTDIDLYAKQHIDYEYSSNTAPPGKDHFDANYPTVLFNNVMLSVGMEKQWNNVIAQICPFIRHQVAHAAYKKDEVYYGFSARILYRFGK